MIRRRLVSRKVDLAPIDWRFYLAIGVAIASTNLFYHFIVGLREFFRHTMLSEYPAYVTLPPSTLYAYNFFFAFMSSTVGFMAFTKTLMTSQLSIPKLVRARILFDQQYVPATFIHLFLKVGMCFSILSFADAIFGSLDFGKTLLPLMIISMLFLFMQQWLTLRLRVRQASFKVMLVAFLIQCSVSAVIAAIPIYDFSNMEAQASKLSPLESLKLDLPRAKGWGNGSNCQYEDLHLGYRKSNNKLVMSFGPFESEYIPRDSLLIRFLHAEKVVCSDEDTIEQSPGIQFFCDTSVPAKEVFELMRVFRKKGDLDFKLMTNNLFSYRGLPFRVKGNLISAVEGYDVFTISISATRMELNDSLISTRELYDWAHSRVIKQSKGEGNRTILIPVVSDSTTYGDFIRAYDETYTAFNDIRVNELKKHSPYGDRDYYIHGATQWMNDEDQALMAKFEEIYWNIIAN